MPFATELIQFTVSWADTTGKHELILYAKDAEDARKNATAPSYATVTRSNFNDRDLRKILMKSSKT